jgi:hypothetical protein
VEGVVGLSALLGREISGQKVIVQAPVTALRMTSVDCKVAFDESAAVRIVMLQFAQRLHDIASQTAACNRLHSLQERCARWRRGYGELNPAGDGVAVNSGNGRARPGETMPRAPAPGISGNAGCGTNCRRYGPSRITVVPHAHEMTTMHIAIHDSLNAIDRIWRFADELPITMRGI